MVRRIKKNLLEKMQGGIAKILAKCSTCKSIKVQYVSRSIGWRVTILNFTNVKEEECPRCLNNIKK